MSHLSTKRIRSAAAALVLVLLAGTLLAACGSSGGSSTATASVNASAATTTAPTGAPGTPGAPGGRFTALRECLAKNGVTLPKRTPGQVPRPGGGFLGGGAGAGLPAGVSRAQFEAALKKCGGFARRGFGGTARFSSPAAKAALAKFAACMRENGENLPAPNTSGSGPVFDTKALSTTSPRFRAAQSKCMPLLRSGFVAPGAPAGTGGSPPAAG